MATALVVGWNLAVTASWYTDLNRYGAQPAWTDAIYEAKKAIERTPNVQVCALEWGFSDNLKALSAGKIQVCVADDPSNDEGRKYTLMQMARPDVAFITHTPGNEIEKERSQRIQAFAKEQGFRMTDVQKFADSNGRETILMYRLSR